MEKEFVPYELAVKLKELGFDEPCFGCFNHLDKSEIWTNRTYMNGLTENITAPTFSQVFRWFREKHGLLSLTDHKTSHGWFYRVYFGDNEWYGGFVKYKEAELACLTKLIEIVEQQNQK